MTPGEPTGPLGEVGATGGAAATRVTTLELFFDLVFVFTITQLTRVLVRDPSVRGLAQVVLMLGVIWWMYGGYAWLTNAVPPDRASRRLLLLAGMASFLVLALSIPHAFSRTGTAFGAAYLAVVVVHALLFTRASSPQVARAIFGIAPFNLLTAALVLAAGIAGGATEYVVWSIAVALEWVTPLIAPRAGEFEIEAAHFVERHGLVVMVAIGESVVAVGVGAARLPLDAPVVAVAVLGLLLSAGLWWLYFGGGDDTRAEHALAATPSERRPLAAIYSFGYWHLLMLLGIVAAASALEQAIGHAFAPLATGRAAALGGGIAAFLLGDTLFRRSLAIGPGRWRAAAAALALATIPLGAASSATLQLAVLVALLALTLVAEAAARA